MLEGVHPGHRGQLVPGPHRRLGLRAGAGVQRGPPHRSSASTGFTEGNDDDADRRSCRSPTRTRPASSSGSTRSATTATRPRSTPRSPACAAEAADPEVNLMPTLIDAVDDVRHPRRDHGRPRRRLRPPRRGPHDLTVPPATRSAGAPASSASAPAAPTRSARRRSLNRRTGPRRAGSLPRVPQSPAVQIVDDPDAVCAEAIAGRLRVAVQRRGSATLAVSGGSTAPAMLGRLAALDLPWADIGIWQVDERVAPDGDPDRNADQLDGVPGDAPPDAGHGAPTSTGRRRATPASLPDRFDVVHLGMGADGHTASWPPGDPVIEQRRAGRRSAGDVPGPRADDADATGRQRRPRPASCSITGADKAAAVAALARGRRPRDLPIARVPAAGTDRRARPGGRGAASTRRRARR